MNRAAIVIGMGLVCIAMAALGAACASPKQIVEQPLAIDKRVTYRVTATFDPAEGRIEGIVDVAFAAPYEGCDKVWLWSEADVTAASIDETDVRVERGDAYTLLALPQAQARGQETHIGVCFSRACERVSERWQVADYVPLVCAYKDGEYRRPAPSPMGEYREVAEGGMTIALTAPKSQVVAVGGEGLTRTYDEGKQTVTYETDARAHPYVAASPYLMCKSAVVGNTTWEYYAETIEPLAWESVVGVARKAYDLWGDVGRERVCIVGAGRGETAGWVGAESVRLSELTRCVVRQWGLPLGENTVTASMGDYMLWAYYHAYNEGKAVEMKDEAKERLMTYAVLYGMTGDGARMDRPIGDYTADGYSALLLDKGLLMWINLHELGGDVVGQTLSKVGKTAWADTASILASLKAATGCDYTYYMTAWIEGKVLIV